MSTDAQSRTCPVPLLLPGGDQVDACQRFAVQQFANVICCLKLVAVHRPACGFQMPGHIRASSFQRVTAARARHAAQFLNMSPQARAINGGIVHGNRVFVHLWRQARRSDTILRIPSELQTHRRVQIGIFNPPGPFFDRSFLMPFEPLLHFQPPCLSRRGFLTTAMTGLAASTFAGRIAANAAQLKKEGRSCVLVWLAGAPSQLETWDPKPGTDSGGPTKSIRTAASGVQIAEHWPKLARQMRDVSVIRSLKGREAAHERGTYHLHTGRRMGGPTKFPNFGSVVADQIGDSGSDLPNFVSIGRTLSSGFLGVSVAPFSVDRPGQLPQNVAKIAADPVMRRRLELLGRQEADFAFAGAQGLVEERKTLYERAVRMMNSPRLKAFQMEGESASVQEAYGKSTFGQGMLVARRLIEAGVPFVEVRRGGWDMHNSIFDRIGGAAGEVDRALSQLLVELKQRGRLEKTLGICMVEFGRMPKINSSTPKPRRDHWARNFNLLLAGGGIRGGRVVGRTSENGQEIVDRELAVEDLFQTLCQVMQIDASEELYTPDGRPLKIVDGGEPIRELLS